MSPFCPQCLGVLPEEETRCGLDQQFLHRRSCKSCSAEMYPRELYCAHCGALNHEPAESLLVPPNAGSRRILASMTLDYFTVSLLVFMMAWSLFGGLTMLVAPLTAFLYRAAGRSGGRQSFGQSVFHIQTLGSAAGPADFQSGLKRSLYELLYLPRLLFKGQSAVELMESRASSLEVTLA